MIELPGMFNLRGVNLFRSKSDPSTFFYLPGEPLPESGPNGIPTLQFMVSDKGAILQFGAQWSVEPSLLSKLMDDLSGMYQDLPKELIRLSPAQNSVSAATLSIGDGTGKFDELQSVKSSGYPPFAALFNVQLGSLDKTRVVASLNGRRDFLKVDYKGSLPVEREARVSISGDVSQEVSNLGKNASIVDALALVESAIAKGRLKVEESVDEEVSQDLKNNINRQAKEKAASTILAMAASAGNSGQAKLESTVSGTETAQVPLESSTDISSWFPGGTGADHIIVVGVTITEPDKSSVTEPVAQTKFVKLGFEAIEMPVAFIELKLGDVAAKMVGPGFADASLPAAVPGELVVRTNYSDGGPAFETKLPLADSKGWTLKPEDLGMTKIVLDGSRPRAAGSTDARVRVVYRPSGKGTYDDRTIYFRRDSWTTSWFIVTRSADLEGSLVFDWRETAADGSVLMHPSSNTDKTELQL
jgi:hypothetical protein